MYHYRIVSAVVRFLPDAFIDLLRAESLTAVLSEQQQNTVFHISERDQFVPKLHFIAICTDREAARWIA